MSSDELKPTTSDIRAEAGAWIAQLETGDLKHADIEAFREWVQRSPRHSEEMRRLAHLSAELNVLTDLAGPLREAARHYQGVSESRPSRWRTTFSWAASAAVALLLVAIVITPTPSTTTAQNWPLIVSTSVGEYQEQMLSDGSTMALNTNSRLEVEFSSERRSVRLLKGEVFFTVANDPDRSFVVFAGDKSVEAIGTAFVVRHDADAFEVAVTEGTVRLEDVVRVRSIIAPTGRSDRAEIDESAKNGIANAISRVSSNPIVLQAGQRIVLSGLDALQAQERPAVESITESDLRRKLAWQEGLLEFSDTPLDSVIREVSRHTTLKIEIADSTLRDLKFGGMFRTGDTEPLFKALEAAYDIHAVQIDEDTIQLTRANSG